MTRRIIQIAVGQSLVYALCDDGTLWCTYASGSGYAHGPWEPVEQPGIAAEFEEVTTSAQPDLAAAPPCPFRFPGVHDPLWAIYPRLDGGFQISNIVAGRFFQGEKYWLAEAPDLAEAIEIARHCPHGPGIFSNELKDPDGGPSLTYYTIMPF